jgi:transposase
VLHVTEGKGKATLQSIQQHRENKGVDKEQVEPISRDLSPSFIAGAAESFLSQHSLPLTGSLSLSY